MGLLILRSSSGGGGGGGPTVGSLVFTGDINGDDGRVKLSVQGETNNANFGDTDFCVECWLDATASNQAAAVTAGANVNWTTGNIFFDRDVFGTDVAGFGACLGDGRVAWGLNVAGGSSRTIVGTTDIRGAGWTHIAFQRRASDGFVSLHVGGTLEASSTGPTGSLQYPDSHTPQNLCGPSGTASCDFSDPYMVLGTEKHDANAAGYFGGMSEFRVSDVLRYAMDANLTVPGAAFTSDGNTRILYHFGDGSGNAVTDSSSNGNHATRVPNASSEPTWSASNPF